MIKNNTDPAFPTTEEHGFNSGMPGMTLRDYFAAKTLTGAFNSRGFTDEFSFKEKAEWVYEMADAMIEARSKT
jgi:hypothetical protein